MRFLTCLIFTLSTVHLSAHSDPLGEKHPLIVVDAKENFRIFYDYRDAEYQDRMSLLLAENGQELIPRHRLSPSALQSFGIPAFGDSIFYDRHHKAADASLKVEMVPEPSGKQRLVMTSAAGTEPPAEALAPRLLPFEVAGSESLGEYTFTSEHVATLSVLLTSGSKEPDTMILRCCRRTQDLPSIELKLTNATFIYDSPTASPPVWASGRFWVAWVRQLGSEEKASWTTVLTGLDPVTGKAEHHDLQGLSHWNTTVDLVANANGVLCAAWVASIDGSYPGRARLVTAVFTPTP